MRLLSAATCPSGSHKVHEVHKVHLALFNGFIDYAFLGATAAPGDISAEALLGESSLRTMINVLFDTRTGVGWCRLNPG